MSTQALPDGCTALVKVGPEKLKSLEVTKEIYDSSVREAIFGDWMFTDLNIALEMVVWRRHNDGRVKKVPLEMFQNDD